MSATNYAKIRFISYAVPTGPTLTAVGTGAYLGSADTQKDIAARIDHDRRFAIVIMTLIQPSLQCLRFDLRSAPPFLA